MAVSRNDTFDFLIDIVPRDDIKTTKRPVCESALKRKDCTSECCVQMCCPAAVSHQLLIPQEEDIRPMMMPPEQMYYNAYTGMGMDPNSQMMYQQQAQQQMMLQGMQPGVCYARDWHLVPSEL
jgi:hypothetical protein